LHNSIFLFLLYYSLSLCVLHSFPTRRSSDLYFRLGKYELGEVNLLKASQHITTDPTVQDHLGDLYQKTGRLKLAAVHWERTLQEWNKTVSAEVDSADVAKVQKKLESAKVKLAKEDPNTK